MLGHARLIGQSHVLRMVLQALDEVGDGFAFIADLVDSSEEWEPARREVGRRLSSISSMAFKVIDQSTKKLLNWVATLQITLNLF